jgi:signal transduction histidine kinase
LKKRERKLRLSAKTFGTFLLFSLIVLLVSALLQTVFLDDVYAHVKEKTLDDALSSMLAAPSYESGELQTLCSEVSRYYDVSVMVTGEGSAYIAGADAGMSVLRMMNAGQLAELREKAVEAGGTYSCEVKADPALRPDQGFGPGRGREEQGRREAQTVSLLSVAAVDSDLYGSLTIYACTLITPLADIVETNKLSLIIMTLVLLVLSLLLSWTFSRSISRPIVEMNNEASKLAASDFNVRFEENSGSLELDELGSKLNYAADRLSRVDQMRNELVANVSHDLRTPLTLITGYSEMMRDLPGENTPENLNLIIDESKHLTDLVNDILDVSKYRSGSVEMKKEVFSITDEVQRTLSRISSLTGQKGYTFSFDRSGDARVCADRTAIGRVLYNLIGNALNYASDDKRIEVRQKVADGKVRIDILDHGRGIAPEELPYVFERYYRSSQNHVRNVLGSGLGLSIVRSILEAHDAGFGVLSTPGEGSDFWFSLDTVSGE